VGQYNVLTTVEQCQLKAMAVMGNRGDTCHNNLLHVLGALPVPFFGHYFSNYLKAK